MHHPADINADTITQAVIARHALAPDDRLRELVTCLVQHLHAFAREVRLSQTEYELGLRLLAEAGQRSDGTGCDGQELALLADALGLSTLVAAQTYPHPRGCTEAAPQHPPRREPAKPLPAGGWLLPAAHGAALYAQGQVRAPDGQALVGAELEVRQCDRMGWHAARLTCDGQGRYRFATTLPQPLALPREGPAGRLLSALGRPAWRPAHLQFQVTAPGHQTLATQVFREGDPHLEHDAALAVRRSLVAPWREHAPGPAPDGTTSDTTFYTLEFNFVLQPVVSQGSEATPLKRAA